MTTTSCLVYQGNASSRLSAPSKALAWFDHSAHEIMNEEPGKLLIGLVHYARPVAERQGDGVS
jgi:hypothetical protein